MLKKRILICTILFCICCAIVSSCTNFNSDKTETPVVDTIPVLNDKVKNILISNEEAIKDIYLNRGGDELFDDFLFCYIHDKNFQLQRTSFPVVMTELDGKVDSVRKEDWEGYFEFMEGEYTTNLYNNEQERTANEETLCLQASVERIDLNAQTITMFEFAKDGGKWTLKTIEDQTFKQSDLADFLKFYSRFSQDTTFQYQSLSKSIRISMHDPDDEDQTLEGFVTKDQLSTLNSGFPEGIISNIRCGQKFAGTRKILMEKVCLGNGMIESFHFQRKGKMWELVAYEN